MFLRRGRGHRDRPRIFSLAVLGCAAAIVLAACDPKPDQMIAAARAALNDARNAGAAEYARGALRAAEEADAALSAELEAQGARPAPLRTYERASSLASAVHDAAERTLVEAELGKERAHRRSQEILDATREALDSSRAALIALTDRAGDSESLMEIESALAEAARLLDRAITMHAEGRYREAEATALSARAAVDIEDERLSRIRSRRAAM